MSGSGSYHERYNVDTKWHKLYLYTYNKQY